MAQDTKNKNDCNYWLTKAKAKMAQGSYDSALVYTNNSLTCFKAHSNKRGQADALTTLGNIYEHKTDFVTGVKYYLEAVRIYDELGDDEHELFAKRLIALYYQRNKEYAKAKDLFFKQLEYFKKKSETSGIAHSYTDLALVYQETEKFDSAIYYLNEAYQLGSKINDQYRLGIVTNNLGDIYRVKKSYGQAISYYNESMSICEKINDIEGSLWTMNNLALIYIQQGNFNEAENLLQKARDINKNIKVHELLKINYLNFSILDSARQNFRMAYHWYKAYKNLEDSLSSAQNSKIVHEMNVRFDSDRKDREIRFLSKERQSYFVLLIISGVLIFSLSYLAIYKIRTERKLNIQKLEVSKKNEELHQLNKNLEDLIRENEGLIGVVAHDLRSPLSKTTGLLNLIKLTGPVNKQQDEMITMIEKVCKDGNVLIKDLLELSQAENNSNPQSLSDRINVNRYLESLVLQHQQRAIQKEIHIELKSNVPPNTTIDTNEEELTRILDNLVSNAIKFSNIGSKVFITVHTTVDHLVFKVQDEGPGIGEDDKVHLFKKFKKLSARPTAGEPSTGLGLSIVKSLIDRLKGSITVESELRKGTTFIISIPTTSNTS